MSQLEQDLAAKLEHLADAVRAVHACLAATGGDADCLEMDATGALMELAVYLDRSPAAFNRVPLRRPFFSAAVEVVRQVEALRASGKEVTAEYLIFMKYVDGPRKHLPVMFSELCRTFDEHILHMTDLYGTLELCLREALMSISNFCKFLCQEMLADCNLWCFRGQHQTHGPPHASVLDLTDSQKSRVIRGLGSNMFVFVPFGYRDRINAGNFTNQWGLLCMQVFTEFLHWLKIQQARRPKAELAELTKLWFLHQNDSRFWEDIWHFVDKELQRSRTMIYYKTAIVQIKKEAIDVIHAMTYLKRTHWDVCDSAFLIEDAQTLDANQRTSFREAMQVVASHEHALVSYFLLFGDSHGPSLPPPMSPSGACMKIHPPFRLGIAPDGFWWATQRVDLAEGKTVEAIVAAIKNQLKLFDDIRIVTPTRLLLARDSNSTDQNNLAKNISLNLLERLEILALFGNPVYFSLLSLSGNRENLIDTIKAHITQDNFLDCLIQRLAAEDEGDLIPHIDHIKPIAVHEMFLAERLKWMGVPNVPAVRCLQAFQVALRDTKFGNGSIGLPSVRKSAFLKALNQPEEQAGDGWLRLGCFVYKEGLDKVELSEREAFEAFIRGVGFCDDRYALIPVCRSVTQTEAISSSCFIACLTLGRETEMKHSQLRKRAFGGIKKNLRKRPKLFNPIM